MHYRLPVIKLFNLSVRYLICNIILPCYKKSPAVHPQAKCLLLEYCKKESCCNSRTNYSGNIRSHSVHEKVVVWVFLLSDLMDDTSGHRNGGDTSGTNHWVDLAFGDEAHKLSTQETADSGDDEG